MKIFYRIAKREFKIFFFLLKERMEEREKRVTWSWAAPERRQLKARSGVRVNSAEHFNSRYFLSHSTKILENLHPHSGD